MEYWLAQMSKLSHRTWIVLEHICMHRHTLVHVIWLALIDLHATHSVYLHPFVANQVRNYFHGNRTPPNAITLTERQSETWRRCYITLNSYHIFSDNCDFKYDYIVSDPGRFRFTLRIVCGILSEINTIPSHFISHPPRKCIVVHSMNSSSPLQFFEFAQRKIPRNRSATNAFEQICAFGSGNGFGGARYSWKVDGKTATAICDRRQQPRFCCMPTNCLWSKQDRRRWAAEWNEENGKPSAPFIYSLCRFCLSHSFRVVRFVGSLFVIWDSASTSEQMAGVWFNGNHKRWPLPAIDDNNNSVKMFPFSFSLVSQLWFSLSSCEQCESIVDRSGFCELKGLGVLSFRIPVVLATTNRPRNVAHTKHATTKKMATNHLVELIKSISDGKWNKIAAMIELNQFCHWTESTNLHHSIFSIYTCNEAIPPIVNLVSKYVLRAWGWNHTTHTTHPINNLLRCVVCLTAVHFFSFVFVANRFDTRLD